MTTTTRAVPAEAFRFSTPFQFAKGDEKDPSIHPISGLARSSEAISHWYWGRVVHDFAGMKPRGETLHLDYCHWDIIGIVNKLSVEGDGLHIMGLVQSIEEADQASKVIARGRLGTPYELSIDFTDPAMRIEEVGEGVIVNVNGQQFTGPLTVIREWELRSVAVCEYGRDSNTEAKFSEGQQQPALINVTVLSQEPSMLITTDAGQTGTTTAPAGTTQLSEQKPAGGLNSTTVPEGEAALLAKLSKFTDMFGDAAGVAHFKAGTEFTIALGTEFKALQAKFAAKDEEIDQLKKALEATKLGADKPVGASDPTPGAGAVPSQFAHLGASGGFAAQLQQQLEAAKK